jgi:citrate synthase
VDLIINVDYRQLVGQLVDARTAAARLGVDVRTLYAYVSRGALRRVRGQDGRSSRYDSDELELLARRSRPRTLPRPAASIDLVVATRVSTVTDGQVRYRSLDVLDLVAARTPFEAVAELLWTGTLPASGRPGRAAEPGWQLPADLTASAALVRAALGPGVPVIPRFAAVVAAAAADDGAAGEVGQPDWPRWGRRLIAVLVEASGPAQGGVSRATGTGAAATAGAGAAATAGAATAGAGAGSGAAAAGAGAASALWQRWSPLRLAPARVRALNTALVLLAEHELAPSTLAVRVAASARAAPAGCVLAGLGTLSGALHGDVPRVVREQLLRRQDGDGNDDLDDPRRQLGFGHPVHRHGDPRAAPLLQAVAAIATAADRQLIELAARGAPAPPNLDFALGALCHVARMPPEAGTAIFAVARTAGWIAHAEEEYAEPSARFRGRAVAPRTAHSAGPALTR